MVHRRVLQAMAEPLVGHLDPYFLELLDSVQDRLRWLFCTTNRLTMPISATGSAGMEACFANVISDGDEVVIGVNGVFGTRMCDVASRLGARVQRAEAPWGRIVEPDDLRAAISACSKPKLVALVHAETSTGAWQPLEESARLAREAGALFLVDAVTSLAGCPLEVDAWGIDLCYSGTQKCISCPPGLSPLTVSERALEIVRSREQPPRSWYLDLGLLGAYFDERRVYHHTAPVSMIYALSEALEIIEEEGLEARFARHRRNHEALAAGLSALGLKLAAQEGHRLWMLNSVTVPEGIDDAALRRALLNNHGIEIGAGLGPLAGKVVRIGLMGESSRPANVRRLLSALGDELAKADLGCSAADALQECERVYGDSGGI